MPRSPSQPRGPLRLTACQLVMWLAHRGRCFGCAEQQRLAMAARQPSPPSKRQRKRMSVRPCATTVAGVPAMIRLSGLLCVAVLLGTATVRSTFVVPPCGFGSSVGKGRTTPTTLLQRGGFVRYELGFLNKRRRRNDWKRGGTTESSPASLVDEMDNKTDTHKNGKRSPAAVDVDNTGIQSKDMYLSHIARIKSYNLAGMVGTGNEENEIVLELGSEPSLCCVTGETGGGKSVLLCKALELATGGKASSSFVPPAPTEQGEGSRATVEVVFRLSEPHLSAVESILASVGIDPLLETSYDDVGDENAKVLGTLVLKRVLTVQAGPAGRQRLKSSCEINGRSVALKTLQAISALLVTRVDAAAASAALARPSSRLAIIDTGVPIAVLRKARETKAAYRRARAQREELERDLAAMVLPSSYSLSGAASTGEVKNELLQHWVDELDAFEGRMRSFIASLAPSTETLSNLSRKGPSEINLGLTDKIQALVMSSWFDKTSSSVNAVFGRTKETLSESSYHNLVEFREALKSLDTQLAAAHAACESLSSLSSSQSAATALQRARDFLFEATNTAKDGPLFDTAEETHELLNGVEDALAACVRSMEEASDGLIPTLERIRSSIDLSIEEIDAVIADWNTLARKHNISPYSLPSCHQALRCELDGNVEARLKLPRAEKEEEIAFEGFQLACNDLTGARKRVSNLLSTAVTKHLPSLGMEETSFHVEVCSSECTDALALGVDTVDFILKNRLNGGYDYSNAVNVKRESRQRKGGKIELVGSSGEKARVLLAIETELPGSLGACCRGASAGTVDDVENALFVNPPVAVIYDEIDAHVGGRAAISLADLLADQTRHSSRSETDGFQGRGQVIAITHNPSVAAIADRHIVIRRPESEATLSRSQEGDDHRDAIIVSATVVKGSSRRKELARMASGDLAPNEAEQFAEALLRDGLLRRGSHRERE